MANAGPVARRSDASLFERTTRIAFRTLSSTFLAAGTLAATVWLLGFWSLVVRARISTGTWPQPSSGAPPDFRPSTVDPSTFGWHAGLVWIGFFAMYYAVPFAMLFLVASVPIRSMRQDLRLVGAFFMAASLAALTVFLDPGRFFLWFLD